MKELQRLLLSDMPLWISPSGYQQLLLAAFTQREGGQPSKDAPLAQAAKVSQSGQERGGGDRAVAVHPVHGIVTASSPYYFSSRQLEADLRAAEADPEVAAHLLHVNSPGGEAWYLDRLGETLDACRKPIVCLYEQCCSAAYHIACHAQRLYATTQFDFVGCIGTMVSYHDIEPLLAKLGIAKVEAKATGSDMKNQTFESLRQGDAGEFTKAFLDPLNEAFLTTVTSHRPQLAALGADHPALRGETYYTAEAMKVGLIDGQRTMEEALTEALLLADERKDIDRLYEI